MAKKKRLIFIVLAAVIAVCLALGIYYACAGKNSVGAENDAVGEKLSTQKLDANSDYLIGSYIDAYGVPASSIKNYTTDGDTESGSLSNLLDHNFSSMWRSKAVLNGARTSISVTFFFKDAYELEGFLYQAEGNGRGYFSDLAVSYHDKNTYDDDEFTPFGSVTSDATGSTVHVKFDKPTVMTAIRLEWKNAPNHSGYRNASASEVVFLQPQTEEVKAALDLFDDYAQLTLKKDVDDAKVTSVRETLESKHKTSPLASWEAFLDPLLNRASQIYNKALSLDPRREMGTNPESTNLLGRHGDVAGYARNTLKFSNFGTNRQATGISARPGEVITVYVEAKEDDPLPSLVFSQHWGTAMMAWKSGNYVLHRGRNVIVTPTLHIWGLSDNNGEPVPSGGPIYLVNPYLPKEEELPEGRTEPQQSDSVKIYIEGGTAIPTFRKGGNVDSYLSDLADYAALVEQDRIDNGDTLKYTMVDVTEVVCDRMTLTVQATRGNYYYNDLGYDPQQACVNWDDYVKKLLMFDGIVFLEEGEEEDSKEFQDKLDSVNAKYDSRNEWLTVNIRLMQPWGAAYAAPEHVGIQVGWDGSGLIGQGWGWGYSHEIGHMLDITERLVGECSNNMISKFDETVLEKTASRGDFAQNLAQLSPDDHMKSYFNTNRLNFTIWWLIESYMPGYWAKLENLYRYYDLYSLVEKERKGATINATEKQIFLSSLVTGIDLSYYFERWGYNLTGSNEIFTYDGSSDLFKLMMKRAKDDDLFDDTFKPKLWYLDAAEWWERYGEGSYTENPCYDEDYSKGKLYSSSDKAPKILNITQSGNSYSLMIDSDEKYNMPGHLGYEVQVKVGEEDWKVVGFTYGRIFSDTHTYETEPTYRLVAYDRALQCSAPGETKAHTEAAIKEVCKIEEREGTFDSVAAAVEAAQDGDTIILLKSSYESGIIINKKLTIKTQNGSADDTITITKSGSDPIFKVVEQSITVETVEGSGEFKQEEHFGKLTLEGVTLDGFDIESDGSLVHVEAGELTLTGCVLKNGKFKYGNNSMGGALRFEGGTLTVKNTKFINNSARLGGAVCVTHRADSTVTFEGCTFEKNTAHEGGGLYNTGTITLTDCEFNQNSAESVGGGFANVSGGVMYVHDCSFTGNTTEGRGGGFYADGRVDLFGGTLTKNQAKVDGAAFSYSRSSSGARPLSVLASEKEEKSGELPSITGNISANGSAVTLHGQVDKFYAEIKDNSECKYAVRMGGTLVNLDGGTIEGDIFREVSGTVSLNDTNIFAEGEEAIKVYTDSEEARIVVLTAGKDVTLDGEYAKKFVGENNEEPSYDKERSQIAIDLDSFAVTFNIKISETESKTEVKHYRPGSSFTFESFTGDKTQQWYVKEWRDSEEKTHKIGEKFEVKEAVTFTAVIGTKVRIEFKVEGDYEGVSSQIFYAMPGEKYTLPKFNIEGYAHNGWEVTTGVGENAVTKMYQPATSFRASADRLFTAVIVKKFTVEYWVDGKDKGLESLKYATRSQAYGSKLVWESCDNTDYVPFDGFIEGFYIRNSDGTLSKDLVDFNTYTVTSDLVLVASVIDSTSMICYMIYDDGITETGGEFVGEPKFSYIPYDIDYTLDDIAIPEGYHVTSVTFTTMVNEQTLTAEQLKDYTFKVVDPYYVVVANVAKNDYTITYLCNDVLFRTETMRYGTTLTFSDPTNSLLKEAVRGFKVGIENPEYSFINYQLISANPKSADSEEPENIVLNVMLDDQITVTEDLTINIVAYIEGYQYEADDSGSKLVEEWRSEYRQYVSELEQKVTQTVNDPKLVLTADQKQEFIRDIKTKSAAAVKKIEATVSYDQMRAAWTNFEAEAKEILAKISARATKNAALDEVTAAMNNALLAFNGMEDVEGSTTIQEARAEIEKIAKDAQSSIESSIEESYDGIVKHAQEEMQRVVVEANGDRIALQKNNAITTMAGYADRAKRQISALNYLSSTMKAEYVRKLDEAFETAKEEVNKIAAEEVDGQPDLDKVKKAIDEVQMPFTELTYSCIEEAQRYNDSKLGTAEELNRGNALIKYAAEITEAIKALLQEKTEEIKAEGIIRANDELIANLTSFANERIAAVVAIRDAALAALVEIVEDQDNHYISQVEEEVAEAKTDIEAEKTLVETDFSTKIAGAEQASRAEIIALRITALAESTRERFAILTLGEGETYTSQLTKAEEKATQTVQTAENIEAIEAAVTEFTEEVEKISLEAERTSALAVVELTVGASNTTLAGYDFLDGDWVAMYMKQITEAAKSAKEQINACTKSEDVIAQFEIFSTAVNKTLGEAEVSNGSKGAEAKIAATEEIISLANEKSAAIKTLGFLTAEEKAEAEENLKATTEEAKKNIAAASSKAEMNELLEAFKADVTGESGIFTKAQNTNDSVASEKKNTAKSKAQSAAETLKKEIEAFVYLPDDEKAEFTASVEEKLQQTEKKIDDALTESGIAEASASFEQEIGAVRAVARERDNAIKGDEVAHDISEAIKAVEKKIAEVRAQMEALAFLTEEARKPFSDELTDALTAATLEISAAKEEAPIPALQEKYCNSAEATYEKANQKNTEMKEQAVQTGTGTLNAAANETKEQIEALTHLENTEKKTYTDGVDTALTAATSGINNAGTPAEIETAVKNCQDEFATQLAKARAADTLAAAKGEARSTLDSEDPAVSAINALGFLEEGEKQVYLDQITKAAETAKEAVNAAATADEVSRAMSDYASQVEAAKNAAIQQDSESAIARKAAKKEEVSKAAATFYSVIETQNYITEESKRLCKIHVTTLEQEAHDEIRDAVNLEGIEAAFTKFEAALEALKSEIGDANTARQQASIQSAIEAIDAAAQAATSTLNALRGKFLEEREIDGYIQSIEQKTTSAKSDIRAAATVEEVEALLAAGKTDLNQIVNTAENSNTEKAQAAKQKGQASREDKVSKATFNGLTSLSEEEKKVYDGEVISASNLASTGILDATNQQGIDDALAALTEAIASINARAALHNEKNSARTQAQQAAEAAKNAVEELTALSDENKTTYKNNIEAELASAEATIEAAASVEDVKGALEGFTSTLEGVKKGATQDAADTELANKKNKVRGQVAAQKAEAEGSIDAFEFLDETAKQAFKKQIAEKVAAANTAIDAAENTEGVENAHNALTAAIEDISKEAAAKEEECKEAIERAERERAEKLNALKEATKQAVENAALVEKVKKDNFHFLGDAGKSTYTSAIDAALKAAETAIQEAGTEEAVTAAKAAFESAVQAAQDVALAEDAEGKQAAKNTANEQVTTLVNAAKEVIDGHGFISLVDFNDDLTLAEETARDSIEMAEKQDEIDTAVSTLEAEIANIKQNAEKANAAATETARQDGKENVDTRVEALKKKLAEFGFLPENSYNDEITAATQTANTAVEGALDQKTIGDAVSDLAAKFTEILKKAEADNATAKTAAIEAAQEAIKSAVTDAESAVNGLAFLAEKDIYLDAITAAAADEEEKFLATQSSIELEEAKQGIIDAIADAREDAIAANVNAKDAAISAAKAEVKTAEENATAEIEALGFISAGDYDVAAHVKEANTAIDGAIDPDALKAATAALNSALDDMLKDAQAANDRAKAEAVQTATAKVAECREKAEKALLTLGFITKETYEAEIAAAADTASTQIENAVRQTEIDTAVTALETALDAITEKATSMNALEKAAATNAAIREVETAQKEAEGKLEKLWLLKDKQTYSNNIAASVNKAKELLTDPADAAAVNTAREEALGAIETALSDAQAKHQAALDVIETAIEKAKETLRKLKEAIEEAIKAFGFLRGGSTIALMAIDETTKETFLGQVDTIYTAALTWLENVEAIENAAAVDAYVTDTSAEMTSIQEKAQSVNDDNEAAVKEEAKQAVEAKKAELEKLLADPVLTEQQRAGYELELEKVLKGAESSISGAKNFAAVENARTTFQSEAGSLQEEIEYAIENPEETTIKVIVYDITVGTVTYGDKTVTASSFKLKSVHGQELSTEGLILTLTLKESNYSVGKQIALITSISLGGEAAENYTLATVGQQAFMETEITVAARKLYVRVNENGEVTYDGFVNGEDESVLSGKLVLERNGNVVTPSGLSSTNYEIIFESGILANAGTDLTALWAMLGVLGAAAVVTAGLCFGLRRKKQ